MNRVQQALANEVVRVGLAEGQFHKGQVIIDGIRIEFTSMGRPDNVINV